LRGTARAAASGQVAWASTLRHGRPLKRGDLHWQQRRGQAHELWLIVVDASASTRRHGALSRAKGLLSGIFDDAYRQRARLALLTASGAQPRWQRQGLKASAALQPWLAELGAGGGTPLMAALDEATGWLAKRRKRYPEELQRCLILTDGRLKPWAPREAMPVQTCVVDLEQGAIRLQRCKALAAELGAQYVHIDALPAR